MKDLIIFNHIFINILYTNTTHRIKEKQVWATNWHLFVIILHKLILETFCDIYTIGCTFKV